MLKSLSKTKYADSVVETDTRIGRIMDKLRALGLDKNTLVFWTTDNGAWQDVYPDAGYTPFRGTKGTVREGGNRVPAIAWWPGKIKAGHQEPRHPRRPRSNGDLCRASPASSFRRMIARASRSSSTATTCRRCCSAPGKSPRKNWFYFTENELTPGAARVGNYKAVFNLRGDDGAADRRPRGRLEPRLEGCRRNTSPPSRRSSTSGRIRRSATTSS